jgi:hypothetical protein
MRKLVIIAHSLYKSGQMYDKNRDLYCWFIRDFEIYGLIKENSKII